MAFYIDIVRIAQDEEMARYRYSVGDGRSGILDISKMTGQAKLIESSEGENDNRFFLRAAHKLKKHFETGNLPEKTYWAS